MYLINNLYTNFIFIYFFFYNYSELTENPQSCISIYTFVNSILSIFSEESDTLIQDLSNQAIDWALDSFVVSNYFLH